VRETRMLRARWRELETELRLFLLGHERGNPGYGQGTSLPSHRASSRPYQLEMRREQLHAGEPVTATMADVYATEMYETK
jgi:hypothetical protein